MLDYHFNFETMGNKNSGCKVNTNICLQNNINNNFHLKCTSQLHHSVLLISLDL